MEKDYMPKQEGIFMLPEMRYIESELLPRLRERADKHERSAQKQLRQWAGEKGVCNFLLELNDLPELNLLPRYNFEEIHYDVEKMFVRELRGTLGTALADGDAVPSVRANVGCGAICTLLGGLKQTFYPDKMPWLLKHLSEEELLGLSIESIQESDEFKMGMEQMRYMKKMLEGTGIQVYPIDLQGPIDLAHLFMGDEFFYALYDDPDLVHHVLRLSVACATYAMEKCFEIIQPKDYVCHYGSLVLPADKPLKVSEDTSTLLCEAHLKEFMQPYTEQILAHFGGGYIHYCGDNKHLYNLVPHVKNNIGMNFGNPERHDPKDILPKLGALGKCYFGHFPGYSPAELAKLSRQEDGRFSAIIQMGFPHAEQERLLDEFAEATR